MGKKPIWKQQYKNRLKDAVLPEGDTINLEHLQWKRHRCRGNDRTGGYHAVLCRTSPASGSRTAAFKNANQQLADYIPSIPEGTIMLFVESEVDKRGKLYKAVNKKGSVVEFTAQNERTLTRWILGILKSEKDDHFRCDETVSGENGNRYGAVIRQELEKLICYCMEKESITEEDVAVISR